eukprot:m.148856 g.148856  ORF g.148856 m.148856 type:complete len:181 (+) comp52754_c0_seq19:722-1264(+)
MIFLSRAHLLLRTFFCSFHPECALSCGHCAGLTDAFYDLHTTRAAYASECATHQGTQAALAAVSQELAQFNATATTAQLLQALFLFFISSSVMSVFALFFCCSFSDSLLESLLESDIFPVRFASFYLLSEQTVQGLVGKGHDLNLGEICVLSQFLGLDIKVDVLRANNLTLQGIKARLSG